MSVVLDTHTVLWYLENSKELSAVARATIEQAIREARDVHVSAISIVETVYLVERRGCHLPHWSGFAQRLAILIQGYSSLP
jgi:PIN domain nuclease of toxin-antitoxin system